MKPLALASTAARRCGVVVGATRPIQSRPCAAAGARRGAQCSGGRSTSRRPDAPAWLARSEGIIPALETAHALAALPRIVRELGPDAILLVNVSGRGDKDMHTIMSHLDPAALELIKEAERGRDAARAALRGADQPVDDRIVIVDGHELRACEDPT